MLVRAAAGLVGCRADSAGKTVFVDGAPAPLAWALAVSLLDAYGWLVWWRDPCATCNPATWWCCCLSPAGDRALRAWDHQLLRKVT